MPKGLFPGDDTGLLTGTTGKRRREPPSPRWCGLQRLAAARLQTDSNIASFTSTVGGMGGATNQGSFSVTLKPAGQRPNADLMVAELTRKMGNIAGFNVFFQNLLRSSASVAGAPRVPIPRYTLRGNDITELYTAVRRAAEQACASCRRSSPE